MLAPKVSTAMAEVPKALTMSQNQSFRHPSLDTASITWLRENKSNVGKLADQKYADVLPDVSMSSRVCHILSKTKATFVSS